MKPSGPTIRTIPDGDDRERLVCGDCGFVMYENPKVIVGAVCTWQDRYLLVRRAIEPRLGYWTMPVGYMELGETTEQGAAREVWEEAQARVEVDGLLTITSIPQISQVHLIYRARMLDDRFAAGPESLEVALLSWDDIPWDSLAYPNVRASLEYEREVKGVAAFPPLTRS
ncbi:NUDIX hydrolase [Paramagnetospirillum marisnigri]|uniref:NUDIX hydrolase n=1 Tax=Paramagnetospirillum marisnigri TaxID=1285242 RepID=A0A178MIH8_9PROT|nr:NUDIX hydrolase [Paramagnetospirillum marisnigri]OAN47977.1 NUDIX hydrolase [Paramagnetospirillum marisnigri]